MLGCFYSVFTVQCGLANDEGSRIDQAPGILFRGDLNGNIYIKEEPFYRDDLKDK